MHELSVAESIVDIVKDYVPVNDLPNVRIIKVQVGEMSGVVSDSLEFCYEAIKTDTVLKNSVLVIEKIPFLVYCNDCKTETTNIYGMRSCSNCGSFQTDVVSGTDMKVSEIELK